MSLSEAKSSIPISELMAWREYLKQKWNERDKLAHMLAALTFEVYRLPYRLFGKPEDCDREVEDFFLNFVSEDEDTGRAEPSPLDKPIPITPPAGRGNLRKRSRELVHPDDPLDESPEAVEKRKKAAYMKSMAMKGVLLSQLGLDPETGKPKQQGEAKKTKTRKPPTHPKNKRQ